MYKSLNKIVSGLLLCLLSVAVLAEKADREKPMNIEAATGTFDQKTMTSVFTGNVVVIQGTMRLTGAQVTVTQDDQGNQFAQGTGSPVKFRQKMDSGEMLDAQSLRFDYNGKTGILKLFDKAWVRQGTDEVHGDIITYDMNQETYKAETGNTGRVKVTIVPKQKNAQAASSAPTASASAPAPAAKGKS
jgi:lipopolysaccharide export system protein LptA